ncbi:MAG: exodeoxyribonuclease V subunit alpha [Pseudonocardiaceae bacterium]|nr:exodeoxyribonuclease V subunit alpha [Pseudonocardiaceae bacterium]
MSELRLAQRATGLLRAFNQGGVLDLADVHVADRVAALGGEPDEPVRLAVALAVRGIRLGSVCIDLAEVGTTVLGDSDETVDVSALPWPAPDAWLQACERSPLVTVGDNADLESGTPLRLVNGLLYLDRYWRQEEQVRSELLQRELADPPPVDVERLRAALARLFPDDDRQRLGGAVSALRWVTVLAGGPGTGKTTTVARLLALLHDQPGGPPRVALAAPTGKAAARLEEAVRAESAVGKVTSLGELHASTLHRLLGVLPGARSRFRHDRRNRLPYDVIVVDETSMVSLTLMARLLEASHLDARLVLVGDPDQLASVEAGAVLGDLTRAPGSPDPALQAQLAEVLGPHVDPVVNGVVTLEHPWRYGGEIDALARAIQAGDDDATVELLRAGQPGVAFVETDTLDSRHPEGLDSLRTDVVAAAASLASAARSGDVDGALRALEAHRLLCAHRRGPYGVSRWSAEVERWLAREIETYAEDGEWYLGRPLLVTANDYDLGLYNGDAGVVVHSTQGPRAAFARGGAPTLVAPVRLSAVQTVHAMTVHRSQGSQFERVTALLPPAESPLLTRELLYTAVTRARTAVRVIGTEAAVRAAVRRPITRASGLRHRLHP